MAKRDVLIAVSSAALAVLAYILVSHEREAWRAEDRIVGRKEEPEAKGDLSLPTTRVERTELADLAPEGELAAGETDPSADPAPWAGMFVRPPDFPLEKRLHFSGERPSWDLVKPYFDWCIGTGMCASYQEYFDLCRKDLAFPAVIDAAHPDDFSKLQAIDSAYTEELDAILEELVDASLVVRQKIVEQERYRPRHPDEATDLPSIPFTLLYFEGYKLDYSLAPGIDARYDSLMEARSAIQARREMELEAAGFTLDRL
ncbi:MAG: hypothetical protein WD226_08265 [Planctomycetota bacterium]